ncbi:helix-turn-helix domain-containing protein [Staphylococcus equorum]|nr:helix-turn-helix domain-containing protein [Staphylococcus equorum]MCM3071099.1 helix-turn-helix domain-containing protein [Staphylococcus equorum]CCI58493.1 putative phage protein [Staphylococcus equorum subsp. equorum Mu2]
MEKKIGDYIRKLRKDLGMTLEDFSRAISLSKSYINQIEKNERTPSKQKLFEIICYFNEFQKIDPQLPTDEIIIAFSDYKQVDYKKLLLEYNDFVEGFHTRLKEHEKNSGVSVDNIDSNKFEYPTDHGKNLKELDKPYFDLEWLLSQNEFHVFYGKKYITDTNQIHTDSFDSLTYNKLNDDDKKMIKNVIESIFDNKYQKYKAPDVLE